MQDIDLIKVALSIAEDAHKEQTDLDGKPEFFHPLEVGLAGTTTDEMVVGFLHDVVEDSDYTFEDLLARGIPEHIVDTLRLLTHSKSERYDEYLQRIATSGNKTAIIVKWNDLSHNLDRGIRGGHTKQVLKHTRAKDMLRPYYEAATKA